MESVTKQSMLELLNECLKDSNLETVTKAELRKKYLEKTGLTKLPHEDKKLFTSAVNTAYLNYIASKTATADITDETKIDEASDDEIKESSEDWKLIMSSSSDDDITPGNIKENVINDQFTNGENYIKETSGDEITEKSEHKMLIMDSSTGDNISTGNIQENGIDDQFMNGVNDIKMESSSDFDEKSLASHKSNIIKKSPLASTLSGLKRQRGKRTLISSSEDETIQLKPTKRNKVLKKARRSSDLEAQPITKSEEKKKVPQSIKNQNCFKKAMMESSDSEDEPLSVFQKESNSLTTSLNSLIKSDVSENMKKQLSNPVDSEDELIMSSTKKKTKFIDDSKNHSSDSEDEPLIIFQKSNNSIHSNGEKMKFETRLKSNGSQESMKSKNNSSDSEDEPFTKYMKCNDSIHSDKNSNSFSKKKLNSASKFSKSIESTSGSEDESLGKYSKKKVDNSIDSSDFEDEPLNNFSNKKMDNSNDSKKKPKKKPSEKIVKGKVKHSLKKPLTNNSKSKEGTLKKKRFVDSDDDSDEQPIATLAKKSDPVNSSLKSVKNSSDSEDEPLNKLSNKDDSNNSEKEPVGKIIKGKVKLSLKKPITNSNKSKEQTLKKKRFVDSDDDANISNRKKEKLVDGQRDSLLSDSYEVEPLSSIKKEPNNSSDSEDDASIFNQKKEKSFNEQKNSLLSDSCEDELLSNMKKQANSSSASEDEPLNKLSTKKYVKKRKNSESGSSSFIDENEEQSSKKNKPSKRKEANDSGKGKKRPSASENKIEHLKKYLRVAGIRISNYNKLFENCKTIKAKCEKMMSLLEKEGLKGRPTLEKCKKLRVKIETKREIAELDVSNILKEGGGRPKRSVCSDTTNCKQDEEKSTPIKKFSRLQDIFDSEESD